MSTTWTKTELEQFNRKKGKLPADNTGIPVDVSKKRGNYPRVPKMSANALTKHALRVLDLKGWDVWRQNNAAVYDEKRKCYRKGSATPGISDILGFHKKTGQFLACEIKVGMDQLSDDQRLFLERVNRAGGIGIECRQIEDLDQVPGGLFLKTKSV